MAEYIANFELNRNTLEFQGELSQSQIHADLIVDYRPSKTSQLINDSGYITIADVPTKLSELVNDTGFITASALIPLENDIVEIESDILGLQNSKVDKVTGKGLSTNDFTNALKTKLEGIEAGAEVNKVNSVNGQTGDVAIEIPDSATWGNITGTLSNQTDLQTALNGKQPTISDLDTIRTGAGKGATALQPNDNITELTNNAGYITSSALTPLQNDITTINSKIPSQATSTNQLADKDFVNSSIATNTANFIGTFNSVAELEAYSGTLTNNDYAFVKGTDSVGNTVYDRYKYNADEQEWLFEYELNNSSFTAAQWAAINSGITSDLVGDIQTAVQPGDLATVATTGDYDDLNDKPDINNGTLTIQANGTTVATFTANQSTDATANITIPDTATWGNITGTLSNQTDLQDTLDNKQDVLTALNAGTDISITNTANRNKTVSGDNSVTLQNAILNGLNSVTLIGACEQSGTPNLSNPINIVCNNGRLVVENIFDKDAEDAVVNKYPGVVPIGSITSFNDGGSYNFKALLMPARPNTEYVFKRLTDCGSLYNRIRVISLVSPAPPLTDSSGTMLVNVSDTTTPSVTFTTLNNTRGLLISVRDGAVVADDWERFVNNVSVVPTKPYADGTTETVEDSLGNTATAENLLSVGYFKDTQEILSGAITRNVGIKILDGTENWTALSSGVFKLSDGIPNFKSQPNNNIGYSNYFSVIPLSTNIGIYISNGQLGWDTTGLLTISNTTTQTVTDFKQWLSTLYVESTPVILVYPLATSTTETVTAQSITTQAGTNVIEITQASINTLPISVNYVANDGTLISFKNDAGYITGITSTDVINALGYTPYNSSNPNGYTSNMGTVTSVNNVQPVNGNVTLPSAEYTAGTGLQLSDQNEFNILQEDEKDVAVNVIGNVTNNNGVYSGFSNSDYLTIPMDLSISSTDSWEIQAKFNQYAQASFSRYVYYFFSNLYIFCYQSTIGINGPNRYSARISNYSPPADVWVKVKRVVNSNNYVTHTEISTNGTDWTTYEEVTKSGAPSSSTFTPLAIGCLPGVPQSYYFNGSIDLNHCYIKVNDVTVWDGSGIISKSVARATNNLYGLVKPDSTSITVNDGVLSANIANFVDSSSTNNQAVGAKLFYDTVGDIETILASI